MTDKDRIAAIEARLKAATPGDWRAMRDGNQYVDVTFDPRAGKNRVHPEGRGTLVGASRIDGLQRPWNPWWLGDSASPETQETVRLKDADADFVANAKSDIAYLLESLHAYQQGGIELPDIVHHVDGEDGPTIGFHVEFPDGRWIWCGELSNARSEEVDPDLRAELNLTNGGGWWLEVGEGKTGSRLLGRVAGEEEAWEVVTSLRQSFAPPLPLSDWRNAIIEECAKIAVAAADCVRIGDGEYGGGKLNAARNIANAIRALKSTKPGGE